MAQWRPQQCSTTARASSGSGRGLHAAGTSQVLVRAHGAKHMNTLTFALGNWVLGLVVLVLGILLPVAAVARKNNIIRLFGRLRDKERDS